VAAVFANPLLRREILFYKLDLERKTRTDEDIREAVRRWKEDAAAAESRYGHISDWDVSRVTNMSKLFKEGWGVKSSFNEDLSRWETGNVTNMREMFDGAGSLLEVPQWYRE